MQVSEVMCRDVRITSPDETIREAAGIMQRDDVGMLPVGEQDRLVGMISDRDIAIRAVAENRSPDTPVREIMSADVKYCFEDDDVREVAINMGEIQVRRLPVLDRSKRLVGIVALADIARTANPEITGNAVKGISQVH